MSIYYETVPVSNPTESSFTIDQLSGLGDWMVDLFGKPSSWYQEIDNLQKEMNVLSAQVNEIGRSMWDFIRSQLISSNGSDLGFAPFSQANDALVRDFKGIIITSSHTPSDAQVAQAKKTAADLRQWVTFALGVAPELAAKVEAEGQRARESVGNMVMRSPAEVGVEVFKEELERRAKIFGGGAIGVGITLLLVALSLGILRGIR